MNIQKYSFRHVKKKVPLKKESKQKSLFVWMLKWGVILFIWSGFFLGCFILWFSYDLPNIEKVKQTQRRPSITLLTQDGKKLATYGDLYGKVVDVKSLPPHVVQALLAIEDRRFYSHFGIDIMGLLRAVWVNYQAGQVVQGGSTITQQLAKNFLQSQKLYDVRDRSFRRKIQEALLALWLEYKFTKDQILTIYLNRAYLGSGTFGIDAAAQHYFGKSAKSLNLYESSVVVGLLKAPTRYSPANNPRLADQRAQQVLESMVAAKFISNDAKEAAIILASTPPEAYRGSNVRYFCDWVVDSLESFIGLENTDLIITTTLNYQRQKAAEQSLQKIMREYGEKYNTQQMALVSMTPEGAVQAMVGGVNYKASKFNRATQALRQTGSVFKLIVYLAALESGLTPWDKVSDLPIRIGKWRPKNYLYYSKGEVSLADALALSVNTVTVRLAFHVGITQLLNIARKLGINSKLPNDLSLALGTGENTLLELTAAYAVVANHGLSVNPYAILQIKDRNGHIIYQRNANRHTVLIDPKHIQYLNLMLSGVVSYGTGRNAAISRPSAGKTGTSQNDRDSWFIGYTPQLVTGVWAGNDDNTIMKSAPGGSMATRLWRDYMEKALKGHRVLPLSNTPTESGAEHSSLEKSRSLLESLIEGIFGR